MSREERIKKFTPKDVCPDETIREIKKKHIELIKHLVTTEWECTKQNPYEAQFHISIQDCSLVDHNYRKVHIKDGYCEKVPKKYKNGFDVIVNYNDVVAIIKSIVDVPHTISVENGWLFKIYIIQNVK